MLQAGAPSKEARRRVSDCRTCIWFQITILADGSFLGAAGGPTRRASAPNLVLQRTVTAREGVIVLGATHTFAQGAAVRRDFRQIESWDALGRTAQNILTRPPGGLPNGEHRAGRLARDASSVRYDIMVEGTINAFML